MLLQDKSLKPENDRICKVLRFYNPQKGFVHHQDTKVPSSVFYRIIDRYFLSRKMTV